MSASVVLSQNMNSSQDGVNLHWQQSNMSTLKEVTLIYYKNTADSNLLCMDLSPSNNDLNLQLDSGESYSFQLQVTDSSANTVYSNTLQLVAPYVLNAPVIASYVGKDNAVDLVVQNQGNTLTAQDSVEFVCKKADNSIFWIIKPYAPSGNYTLSNSDNALFINNQIYRIACMYQPSLSNSLYGSPSEMSNSMTVEPSNLPNDVTNLAVSSVGVATPALKATWSRPSDFNEWSNSFSIVLRLYNFVQNSDATVTLTSDVVEHTFENLNRNDPYQVFIKYVNNYGNGDEVASAPIILTTVADAPVLNAIIEGDTSLELSWSAPAYDGNSAILGYNVYKNSAGNSPALLTSLGDVLTYTDANCTNGVLYYYTIVARNAIGDSPYSNQESGNPFGDCSVQNVVINGKTLQMTFLPNGRAIEKIFIVALDSNPSEADAPSNFFYEVPTGSISGAVTGTFNLSKTFSTFSDDISFYCVIANNANSSSYLKSA